MTRIDATEPSEGAYEGRQDYAISDQDRIAIYNKRLDKAKIYRENLKIYFKEHASHVIDAYDEVDTYKASEYLERLAKRKDLTDEDEDLVQAFSTVGRVYCGICDKWTGGWLCTLEESLYPPLCEWCAKIYEGS